MKNIQALVLENIEPEFYGEIQEFISEIHNKCNIANVIKWNIDMVRRNITDLQNLPLPENVRAEITSILTGYLLTSEEFIKNIATESEDYNKAEGLKLAKDMLMHNYSDGIIKILDIITRFFIQDERDANWYWSLEEGQDDIYSLKYKGWSKKQLLNFSLNPFLHIQAILEGMLYKQIDAEAENTKKDNPQ